MEDNQKIEELTRAFLAARYPQSEIPGLIEQHLPTCRIVTAVDTGERSVTIRTADGTYLTPTTAKHFEEKRKATPPPPPAPKTRDELTIEHVMHRRAARGGTPELPEAAPSSMTTSDYLAHRKVQKRQQRGA
jgi:hypothetical protein